MRYPLILYAISSVTTAALSSDQYSVAERFPQDEFYQTIYPRTSHGSKKSASNGSPSLTPNVSPGGSSAGSKKSSPNSSSNSTPRSSVESQDRSSSSSTELPIQGQRSASQTVQSSEKSFNSLRKHWAQLASTDRLVPVPSTSPRLPGAPPILRTRPASAPAANIPTQSPPSSTSDVASQSVPRPEVLPPARSLSPSSAKTLSKTLSGSKVTVPGQSSSSPPVGIALPPLSRAGTSSTARPPTPPIASTPSKLLPTIGTDVTIRPLSPPLARIPGGSSQTGSPRGTTASYTTPQTLSATPIGPVDLPISRPLAPSANVAAGSPSLNQQPSTSRGRRNISNTRGSSLNIARLAENRPSPSSVPNPHTQSTVNRSKLPRAKSLPDFNKPKPIPHLSSKTRSSIKRMEVPPGFVDEHFKPPPSPSPSSIQQQQQQQQQEPSSSIRPSTDRVRESDPEHLSESRRSRGFQWGSPIQAIRDFRRSARGSTDSSRPRISDSSSSPSGYRAGPSVESDSPTSQEGVRPSPFANVASQRTSVQSASQDLGHVMSRPSSSSQPVSSSRQSQSSVAQQAALASARLKTGQLQLPSRTRSKRNSEARTSASMESTLNPLPNIGGRSGGGGNNPAAPPEIVPSTDPRPGSSEAGQTCSDGTRKLNCFERSLTALGAAAYFGESNPGAIGNTLGAAAAGGVTVAGVALSAAAFASHAVVGPVIVGVGVSGGVAMGLHAHINNVRNHAKNYRQEDMQTKGKDTAEPFIRASSNVAKVFGVGGQRWKVASGLKKSPSTPNIRDRPDEGPSV